MEALTPFSKPIAHRGLHDRAHGVIENSASAFEAAIAAGYDFECDVQLTGDGQAVVFHDAELDRLTEQCGPVNVLSAGQISRIPLKDSAAGDTPQRLEAMLDQVAGRCRIVIELKHQANSSGTADLARAVVRALKDYAGPLVLESFDPDLLVAAREAGYSGHLGIVVTENYDTEDGSRSPWQGFYLRHMLHWPRTRPSFISSHQNVPGLPMVRYWRARGVPVTTWTVRSQIEADAMAAHADQIVFEGFIPKRSEKR